MPEKEQQQENWGEAVSLDGRINLYPQKPLPDLNTQGGTAVAARFQNDLSLGCFSLVCNKGVYPRVELVNSMKMVDASTILRLREGGVVDWPAQGSRHFGLVYELPLAPPYWRSLDETHPVMSEDSVNHHFIAPLISALLDLQHMGVMHGGIRPTNIFWRDGSTTPPQLGDGLSGPPGFGQPALFETIERAMCPPAGRGNGQHADDCYAFGVTVALVLLGHNPLQGSDEKTVLRSKMEKGSFNTLIGARKLHGSHVELLRGLLADDSSQRWSAEEMEQWLSGRRLTPKSSDAGRRAARHFEIGGKDYWQVRPLAAAMAENVAESVRIIENGSLIKWLARSLGDAEKAKEVGQVIAELKESGNAAHYEDQLVTRVCITLDPSAPIRYRGVSVMPAGISTALVDAMKTGDKLQIISEIIANQFVTLWVNVQKDMKVDLVPLAQQLERMRAVLDKAAFGNGMERVLYELNPSLPCLSPMLRQDCVVSLRQLLPALERVVGTPAQASEPMDRHIAAYLIVRDKRSESIFAAMGPEARGMRRSLAILSIYGDLQYRFGPDRLSRLSAWFMPLLEPCFHRYLSKPFREKVKRQTKDAVDKGNLVLIMKYLDDPQRVTGDEQNFLNARLMYHNIKQELAQIEAELKDRSIVARDVGRPVAASVAAILSIIMIAVMLGRTLLQSLV
jgi:hypothetical protein